MKTLRVVMLLAISAAFFSCAASREKQLLQAEAARNVGEAYMQEGNYTAALGEFQRSEEMNSDDPQLHNDLGLTYMAKKRPDTAIVHFEKALKLQPGFTAARNNLGVAYMALEQWDSAIKTFNEVMEDLLYTTPHFALANLGWAHYSKGEWAEAEKYYLKAVESQPKFIMALRGLGRTCTAMGKHAEAVAAFEKAIEISPRFGPLYLDMAKAHFAAGNPRAAVDVYKKMIILFAGTPYAEEAKKEAGELLLKTGGQSG